MMITTTTIRTMMKKIMPPATAPAITGVRLVADVGLGVEEVVVRMAEVAEEEEEEVDVVEELGGGTKER